MELESERRRRYVMDSDGERNRDKVGVEATRDAPKLEKG
jgi:hypothetical protein